MPCHGPTHRRQDTPERGARSGTPECLRRDSGEQRRSSNHRGHEQHLPLSFRYVGSSETLQQSDSQLIDSVDGGSRRLARMSLGGELTVSSLDSPAYISSPFAHRPSPRAHQHPEIKQTSKQAPMHAVSATCPHAARDPAVAPAPRHRRKNINVNTESQAQVRARCI